MPIAYRRWNDIKIATYKAFLSSAYPITYKIPKLFQDEFTKLSLDSYSDNEYIKWNNKNHQYNWEIETIIGLFIGTLEGMLDFELHKWGLDLTLDLQVGNPNPSKQGVTSGIPLILS